MAFEDSAQTTLSLLDNGLTRVLLLGQGNSRGQVFQINQANLTAALLVNADLGVFAPMLGSAQDMANSNYTFLPGFLGLPSNAHAESIEVDPNGNLIYNINGAAPAYRAWRMPSLYAPPAS